MSKHRHHREKQTNGIQHNDRGHFTPLFSFILDEINRLEEKQTKLIVEERNKEFFVSDQQYKNDEHRRR